MLHPGSRSCLAASAVLGLAVMVAACESMTGDSGGCAAEGPPRVVALPHAADAALSEGSADLPVFDAPQGGPGSELDLELRGIDASQLRLLRTRVVGETGEELHASVFLVPQSVNLACIEGGLDGQDESHWSMTTLPILYADGIALTDLDGVSGELTVTLEAWDETPEATQSFRWPVSLRVTSY